MVDHIAKCVEKLHSDICDKGDELDELYDKIREVEEDLAGMRHKRSLMKIYVKKLKETMDKNITLADLLHVICTDIMNDNYKKYLNVSKISVSWKKSSICLLEPHTFEELLCTLY